MSRKNSSLSQRSIAGFNISIARNTFPRQTARVYHFTTLKKLLDESLNLLALPSFGKKLYTIDGKLVKDESEIKPRETYLISCGEPFASDRKSKVQNSVKNDVKIKVSTKPGRPTPKPGTEEEEEEETHDGNNDDDQRMPSRARSIYDSVSFLFQKEEHKEEEEKHEEEEDKMPKVKLLRSPKTVEEQFRDENYARFCMLDKKQMMKVPNSLSIRAMIRNTQREKFIQSYVDNNIKSEISIDDTVNDLLFDRKPLTIQYAICGPIRSGRSSVLYEIAKSLYVKLQTSKPLVVMMNFENINSDFYSYFINSVMEGLRYCAFQITPLADLLQKWLLSVPLVESLTSLPAPFYSLGNVNPDELKSLGRDLHKSYHRKLQKRDETRSDYYKNLASVPERLAKATNLENVYYVIDHFDLCPIEFRPFLASTIMKSPFIVSASNNSELVKTLPKVKVIETENLIKPTEKRILIVSQLGLRLSADDCLGCPTYIRTFVDLLNSVAGLQNKAIVKNKYSSIKSSIDDSRRLVASEKLKTLCESLLHAGCKAVNIDIVNSIDDFDRLDFVIEGKNNDEKKKDKFTYNEEIEYVD